MLVLGSCACLACLKFTVAYTASGWPRRTHTGSLISGIGKQRSLARQRPYRGRLRSGCGKSQSIICCPPLWSAIMVDVLSAPPKSPPLRPVAVALLAADRTRGGLRNRGEATRGHPPRGRRPRDGGPLSRAVSFKELKRSLRLSRALKLVQHSLQQAPSCRHRLLLLGSRSTRICAYTVHSRDPEFTHEDA